MSDNTEFDLSHFRNAQDTCYHRVKAELSMGQKRSHWIWFIFPQLHGLGQSMTARAYAIESLAEAQAYMSDGLLAGRLRECCQLLLACNTNDLTTILGKTDSMKVRSCVTLFSQLPDPDPLFRQCLVRFFDDKPDPLTLRMLAES